MTYSLTYQSPLGPLCLTADDNALTGLHFGAAEHECENEILKLACTQLDEYFSGERKSFDLPVEPAGTPFQRSVWNALCDIPYGQTRAYADIAAAIGKPKAVRAVGGANNRNPVLIIIPCHRVIGRDGSLTGYAGGLEAKRALLALENKNK